MTITLVYLHVVAKSDPTAIDPTWYLPCSERFIRTYKDNPPGIPHELAVVSCGGPINHHTVNMFSGVATKHIEYLGSGWDLGAHQFAAWTLQTCDLMVFMATPCHFKVKGWLVNMDQPSSPTDKDYTVHVPARRTGHT